MSKIIPILKPGKPPGVLSSYRPINLLSSLSKIIEKVIFTQLVNHLEKHSIIPYNHHGSRAGHSTTTALLNIYEKLINNAENGKVSALIALDQSAAFDLVPHEIPCTEVDTNWF